MTCASPSEGITVFEPGQSTSLLDRSDLTLSSRKWSLPVANTECTFHQLAPYIGKLKSSIAADLIRAYTTKGELIVDPFCGAGTIALEARLAERRIFASDVSPYAELLTRAKTNPPPSLDFALAQIERLLNQCQKLPSPDLRRVPSWVRSYFHPRTLKEAIAFSIICRDRDDPFAFSCLMGILHHQRPGFLSYPSSHLVPYLRSKKFPAEEFSDLYTYRPLRPRLLAKVSRAFKRSATVGSGTAQIVKETIENVCFPKQVDAIITSPPYMNALDYGRDNRLRLWFVDPSAADHIDEQTPSTNAEFAETMNALALKATKSLKPGGYCILIVGDVVSRGTTAHPAETAMEIFLALDSSFRLLSILNDSIPDVRRSRRTCRGVKTECIVVLQKVL
jgi:hypothetical protein